MTAPAAGVLAPIEGHESLAARVQAQLRDAILAGELPPGSRLSVPELARRLRVSRSPVRDAMYALERAGLVETRPRLGAVVFGGGRDELVHLFELREALDGMAARLAATRMGIGEKAQLGHVMDAHRRAVRDADVERHIELDANFHRLIRDGAGNPRLTEDLDRLRDQIVLVMRSVSSEPGAMGRGVLHDHQAILDAVVASAADDAERAARAHVRAVQRFVLASAFGAAVDV